MNTTGNQDIKHNFLGEIEVSYKVKEKASVKITDSNKVEKYLRSVWGNQMNYREQFVSVYLNTARKVIGHIIISTGSATGCLVDNKMILQGALMTNAQAIVVAHNHPSGILKPSDADIKVTEKLKSATKSMDLQLLDHLIITEDGHFSFANSGIL